MKIEFNFQTNGSNGENENMEFPYASPKKIVL